MDSMITIVMGIMAFSFVVNFLSLFFGSNNDNEDDECFDLYDPGRSEYWTMGPGSDDWDD